MARVRQRASNILGKGKNYLRACGEEAVGRSWESLSTDGGGRGRWSRNPLISEKTVGLSNCQEFGNNRFMKRSPLYLVRTSGFFWSRIALALVCCFGAFGRVVGAASDALAGRWDLTIQYPKYGQMPSWLELRSDGGSWRASFVGRWGNARPLSKVTVKGKQIEFVSPKQEEGSTNDLVFKGKLDGEVLRGSARGPNGAAWTWTGKRAPALDPAPNVVWGRPIRLFNGRDFNGWSFDNPSKASSWVVKDGCLVNQSAGSNIATKEKFQDFKLHVEVNCPTNANSGIYLRGRYEVQVEDDSIQEPPSHHMGAVYGFLAPTPELPRLPGAWQTFDITLLGRQVTVVQNGQTIIDRKEIPGITGGAIDSHEEMPGPIYFQGDHGGIAYRNVILIPVK